MAKPKKSAQELQLGKVQTGNRRHADTKAKTDGKETSASVYVELKPMQKRVQPKNRMRENRTSGTVWGVPGNWHSYHDGIDDDIRFYRYKVSKL